MAPEPNEEVVIINNMAAEREESIKRLLSDASKENFLHVAPLSSCPHMDAIKDFAMFSIDLNQECPECTSEEDKKRKENWICLTCHAVNCSRYVHNHAVRHFNLHPDHPMVLSTVDRSAWCYGCEQYVDNEKMTRIKATMFASKDDQSLAQQLADSGNVMFEQSQARLKEIEDEVKRTQTLVSKKETIEVGLIADYDESTSLVYFQKALELSTKYSHIRKIRGDGSCFYRAVFAALIERVVEHRDELETLTTICKSWRQRLLNLKFPDTFFEFCNATEAFLDSIKNTVEGSPMDDLNHDEKANYYVAFLRLITSGFLRENAADYAFFIEDGKTLEQYCFAEIEPMWKECDHLSIIGFINALKTSLRIEYMDRSQAPAGGWYHDVTGDDSAEPKLCILYRPGHYDVLYKKAAE